MSCSSSEDNPDPADTPPLRKRRSHRACDSCRQRKVRCDGPKKPEPKCTYCMAHELECTYVATTKRWVTPKSYLESLESRVEAMSQLLKQLLPGIDLSDIENLGASIAQSENSAGEDGEDETSALNLRLARTLRCLHAEPPAQHANQVDVDDEAILTLAEEMKRNPVDNEYGFFGKSSAVLLIQTIRDIKMEHATTVETSASPAPPYNSFQEPNRASMSSPSEAPVSSTPRTHSLRRPEFWTNQPWERALAIQPTVPTFPALIPPHVLESEPPKNTMSGTQYTFPPHDLMLSLVELYFEHSNTIMPLLHKPTFLRNLAAGRHLQGGEEGEGFGATVLLVCAVGSRWSCDPRVLLDGQTGWHSSGWKWFDQVQLVQKSLLQPAKLWDLQFYCLSVMFLQATSAPQTCWSVIGIGIRLAQEVGAHRRKIRKPPQANTKLDPQERKKRARERMEEEEWARAWWVLVVLDRMASSGMGRPCAILEEDFDLEMPLDVDDEYWEDPSGEDDISQMFRQPDGKPSSTSFFIQLIKLMRLLAFSLRTVYAIHQSKLIVANGLVGQEWEKNIVMEIDSALNGWLENVPAHLRWDPSQLNRTFCNQSVVLYAQYYELQILVHRPFIPSSRKSSALSLPSLAICTNAARACLHMVDIHRQRILKEVSERKENGEDVEGDGRPLVMQPYNLLAAFICGIVLSLNMWGARRTGLSGGNEIDLSKDMATVNKCMTMLELGEERWHIAGRFRDILGEITSIHNLSRHLDDTAVYLSSLNVATCSTADSAMLPAGDDPSRLASYLSPPESSSLPAYADELGLLLLHGFRAADEQPPRYQPPRGSALQDLSPSALFQHDDFSQSSASNQSMDLDRDTMAVWSNAPTGFEIEDWAAYLDLGQAGA